jgi:hypothetical protein
MGNKVFNQKNISKLQNQLILNYLIPLYQHRTILGLSVFFLSFSKISTLFLEYHTFSLNSKLRSLRFNGLKLGMLFYFILFLFNEILFRPPLIANV